MSRLGVTRVTPTGFLLGCRAGTMVSGIRAGSRRRGLLRSAAGSGILSGSGHRALSR